MKILIILFLASAPFIKVFAQQPEVFVVGFAEQNFECKWKPVEKIAKKNRKSVEEVDNLYRNIFLSNFCQPLEGYKLIPAVDGEEEIFGASAHMEQNFEDSEGIFLPESFDAYKEPLQEIFDSKGVDYVLIITRYTMAHELAINLHTKITHRIDYVIFDKDLNPVIAEKNKLSGLAQGAFRPASLVSAYSRAAKKAMKQLEKVEAL